MGDVWLSKDAMTLVVDRKHGDVKVIDRREAINRCIVRDGGWTISDAAERSVHGRRRQWRGGRWFIQ